MTKSFDLGGKKITVVDNGADALFVDILTEYRQSDGVIYLSGGSVVVDGENAPEVHIKYRLRMSLISAQILRDTLSGLIEKAMNPPEKEKAH